MNQEKIAKLLMLVVLAYVGLPALSFEGLTLQTLFSIVWIGFAVILLLSLLFNENKRRMRTVKRHQKARKRIHMGS
ncbi:hypothetical protein [Fictibacillus phosphorivorans]|uniref:hypothetical protein n=1 Tax=Fictibacillus phosphorivorans TaxID=1221500 RepID=UPI0020413260|nr:hypothetical protein [Fictibacillus phosphorivorans]MCM3717931.1 hypothetical protein [Fictibacillus phosphorivorans]MCM3775380.1 hypothetical protein [Fictibacillus phosphorivorans]